MKQIDLRRSQWLILGLCWAAYSAAYFGRVNLSVAIPDIQSTLQLSKGQIGLVGTALFWVYGIGQLINGKLGDSVSCRWFVFIGLAVAGIANLLFGLSSNIYLMVLLWSVNGFFQSMLWGPLNKTLSVWFEHQRRNRVAIAMSTSMVAGYLLAWGVGALLLRMGGWRWVFLVPAFVLLVYAPLWALLARNHPCDRGLPSPNSHLSQVNGTTLTKWTLLGVLKETRLWYVVAACVMQGLIKEGIGLWGPTFLAETHHLDMSSSAMILLFVPLFNFVGMLLAGWLNGILRQRERLASAILLAAAMLSVLGLHWLGSLHISLALLFLGLASCSVYGVNTLLFGVLPLGFAKYNRVSSVAGFLDFCSYIAAGIATPLTGALASAWGWSSAIWMWAGAASLGAILLILGGRRTSRASAQTAG